MCLFDFEFELLSQLYLYSNLIVTYLASNCFFGLYMMINKIIYVEIKICSSKCYLSPFCLLYYL